MRASLRAIWVVVKGTRVASSRLRPAIKAILSWSATSKIPDLSRQSSPLFKRALPAAFSAWVGLTICRNSCRTLFPALIIGPRPKAFAPKTAVLAAPRAASILAEGRINAPPAVITCFTGSGASGHHFWRASVVAPTPPPPGPPMRPSRAMAVFGLVV